MNNLYTFVDWNGDKRIFTMNEVQEELFHGLHNKNVILKARQFGLTTFMCLFQFDAILWRPDCKCTFVAHTRDDAQNIFNDKVRYAYDNLPQWIKDSRPYSKMSDGTLEIIHGENSKSSLRVAVSGRGGTNDYIHISELGKIAAKDPLKAKEIVSGTLNAGPKCIVTIESTAEGDSGVFFDICTKAEEHDLTGEKLTRMDYKFHFFPWYRHPSYVLDEPVQITSETDEYFKKKSLDHLPIERKAWYQKKKEEQGDEMTQEFPSDSEEAFSKPLEGAYYAKQMRRMMEEGRIGDVPWNPDFPVYTYCDIGHSDTAVTLYVQKIGKYFHFFDLWVGEESGLGDMAEDLHSKPYSYAVHAAPHDIKVTEWGSKRSRHERALTDYGINFMEAPGLSRQDGIDAVREVLQYVVIDKVRCQALISAMRKYRKTRLPSGHWSNEPYHDDSSNYADTVRYFAIMQDIVGSEMVKNNTNIDKGAVDWDED